MLEVRPDRVELLDRKKGARLILVNDETRQAYHLDMSLPAGQQMELERQGLAADRCGQYHVGPMIAAAFGSTITSLQLSMFKGGWMSAEVVVEHLHGLEETRRVRVDVIAGLSLAIHINLPIMVDDRQDEEAVPGHHASSLDHGEDSAASVPEAFQEVIRSMDWPETA